MLYRLQLLNKLVPNKNKNEIIIMFEDKLKGKTIKGKTTN